MSVSIEALALAHSTRGTDAGGLAEAIEAREIVERSAARLAALRRTTDDLVRLRSALDGMHASVADPESFCRSDLELHVALWDAARNRPLSRTLLALHELVLEMIELYARSAARADGLQALAAHHGELVDAVERQDADEAAAIVCVMMDRLRIAAGAADPRRARERRSASPKE